MSDEIVITVLQEDWDLGMELRHADHLPRCATCVVAQAIIRQIPDANCLVFHTEALINHTKYYGGEELELIVNAFDNFAELIGTEFPYTITFIKKVAAVT